jgi:hypothetical protein
MINIVLRLKLTFIIGLLLISGCTSHPEKITEVDREPVLEPDYSGVTIPQNIAPMNFMIREDGKFFSLYIKSSNGFEKKIRLKDGIVQFPRATWKKILKNTGGGTVTVEVTAGMNNTEGNRYRTFKLNVISDPVDPWICYRLLYPGYEAYKQLKIIQRSTENFKERSLVENQLLKTNCINCHSFSSNNPERLMVHVRGSVGGTYFSEGNKIVRRDLKASEMKYGAVYPAWHPDGNLVAYSSNSIVQSFHASQAYNVEVTDLASSLVVYDVENNQMSAVEETDTIRYMETFPEWSPDGRFLYYCRARQTNDSSEFAEIKYDLVRKSFDKASFSFGKAEIVFDAFSIGKSVSFPRISPDGKYLVFTLHNNGNFSIWHKEADLYLLDIQTRKSGRMSVNSDYTESYHSWSLNGKWLVFSSKRDDGLTARPYFTWFGSADSVGKPFVLPQKDPSMYRNMIKTFNRPEFVAGKIRFGPRDFERASKKEAEKAGWRVK